MQNPIIPKTNTLLLHTGNIVNWNRLKRRLTQTPTEELTECISSTIESWLEGADRDELQYTESIDCEHTQFSERLATEDRESLKLTVKLFVCSNHENIVEEALNSVMQKLEVSHIETVLLSVPDSLKDLDRILSLWQRLEQLVSEEKVFSIGVCDLNKQQLQQLYDMAQVKPCINQVNLESCCVMPPELTEYAKQQDIQLLTHNDPQAGALPTPILQEVLGTALSPGDGDLWEPSWIVRYSVLIKCRGVIKSKGYVLKAVRDFRCRIEIPGAV
eukprot:GHVU01075563.1.p1 GENE.GHVU01075563.1~~GHVU01075563.1.p1  ORF type:complete len:289 (+),score=44.68 GHVU01075563.1:49-867(+)